MKKLFALFVSAIVFNLSNAGPLQSIAEWTFETSASTNNITGSGTTVSGIGSDDGLVGNGTANAFHAAASTTWSLATGNGSANSWRADNWSKGDYFEFDVNYVGDIYHPYDLVGSFDLLGNDLAPRRFNLEFSTDGTHFSQIGNLFDISSSPVWNPMTTSSAPVQTIGFDTSFYTRPAEHTYYFRIVDEADNSGGAINGGDVSPNGIIQIDNVSVFRTIPEPTTNTLAIFAGFFLWAYSRLGENKCVNGSVFSIGNFAEIAPSRFPIRVVRIFRG